jgi:hypothetical protein
MMRSRARVRLAFRSRSASKARCFPARPNRRVAVENLKRAEKPKVHSEARSTLPPSAAAIDAASTSPASRVNSGARSVVSVQLARAIAKNPRYGSRSASRRRPSRPGGRAAHSPRRASAAWRSLIELPEYWLGQFRKCHLAAT